MLLQQAEFRSFYWRSGRIPNVSLLDHLFARWDAVAADHGVEKIKTIGDAYMVASGIPLAHAVSFAIAAHGLFLLVGAAVVAVAATKPLARAASAALAAVRPA